MGEFQNEWNIVHFSNFLSSTLNIYPNQQGLYRSKHVMYLKEFCLAFLYPYYPLCTFYLFIYFSVTQLIHIFLSFMIFKWHCHQTFSKLFRHWINLCLLEKMVGLCTNLAENVIWKFACICELHSDHVQSDGSGDLTISKEQLQKWTVKFFFFTKKNDKKYKCLR